MYDLHQNVCERVCVCALDPAMCADCCLSVCLI